MVLTEYVNIDRKTFETDIQCSLLLNQYENQVIEIDTGIGFLDHVRIINYYWNEPIYCF